MTLVRSYSILVGYTCDAEATPIPGNVDLFLSGILFDFLDSDSRLEVLAVS